MTAAQDGSSKAPVAAYDERPWVRELRSGERCCLDVQHCVSEQERLLGGGRSWAGSCGGVDEPLRMVQRRQVEVTAVEVLAWYLKLEQEKRTPQS